MKYKRYGKNFRRPSEVNRKWTDCDTCGGLGYFETNQSKGHMGISNYHLTWSYSEANEKYSKLFDTVPNNKAVVFRNLLPSMFNDVKVIDGDEHDMRFLDEPNVVVGLKAKGKAKKDYSGFVIDNLIEARAL